MCIRDSYTAMGYVVLHIEKAAGTDAAMAGHVERRITPANVITTLTYLNEELVAVSYTHLDVYKRQVCDDDTLLIRVIPHGPTCHTGSKTCFGEAVPETEGFIRYLQSVIRGQDSRLTSRVW